MRLFLVGYMGCGKSSIGRRLARRLGVEFVDTDALVERAEQAEIADIVRYEGEQYFRECERRALESACGVEDAVISTGGGLPVWRDNIDVLHRCGKSVYIRRTPEQIFSRLTPYGRHKRPRFRGLNDEELLSYIRTTLAEREPFYTQASATIECTGASDSYIIDHILFYLDHLSDRPSPASSSLY